MIGFNPKRGYALATILILLGVCMFGAAALVTISVLESKISRSQTESTVAYYVAEAGVHDAVWRLNNDSTYKAAMSAGTLNATYTATNKPATGESFTVTLTTPAEGAGYALIDVTGTSNNGTFTSSRRIQVSAFQGGSTPSIGDNALFAGGSQGLSLTNGSSSLVVTNGDFYSRGGITINQATLNVGPNKIEAVGTYVANSANVTAGGGIFASNRPPAPGDIPTPGFDFAQYNSLPTTKCTSALYASQTQLRCTPAQFQTLIGNNTTFSFPNQVVYVSGALTMNSWAKNKTLNFNGLFVVNGGFSITGAASNLAVNVTDPGTGKSGVVASGAINNASGNWNIQGVLYTAGSLTLTNSRNVTVDGAMVAGGKLDINTGLQLNLNFNPTRASGVLGSSNPTTVEVSHWEEEY
jgi:hypothetical protein